MSNWKYLIATGCYLLLAQFGALALAAESGRPHAKTETPLHADSFADSIGVNVNLATLPASANATVASLTKSLGIRHVRIPLLKNNAPYDDVVTQFLAVTGTRALGITDCPLPLGFYAQAGIVAADIQAFQTAIGGKLEAYEAVNEPDTRVARDSHWALDTVACMKTQSGALPNVLYLAPAIANGQAYAAQLGNISTLVDRGNIHRYFSGNNPGTSGWGNTSSCGVYGSLAWAGCQASINSKSKPKIITETGYNSVTEVDETTQAKYLSREMLVNFQAGIERSYIYCMNSYTGGDGFGGSGLLGLDLSPKPAFAAIEHEIKLFSDVGAEATPHASLTYSMATSQPTTRHLLFQKGDGTFLIAVWNETMSWRANGGGEINVPKSSIVFNFPFVPSNSTVEALDDNGNFRSVSLWSAGNSVTFLVDDHVAVLSFKRRGSWRR